MLVGMLLPFEVVWSTLYSLLVGTSIEVGFFASVLLVLLPVLIDFKNELPPEPRIFFGDEDVVFLGEDARVTCVAETTATGGITAGVTLETVADTRSVLADVVDDILSVKLATSSSDEELVRGFFSLSFTAFSDGFGRLGILLLARQRSSR